MISTVFAAAATREARDADVQRGLAESRMVEARQAQKNADEERKEAEEQRAVAEIREADAKLAQNNEAELRKLAERQAYTSDMLLVQRDWEDANVLHMQDLLDRHQNNELRGFEWDYWNHKLHHNVYSLKGHSNNVYSASFSPDGKRIVSGGSDDVLKIWDARPIEGQH